MSPITLALAAALATPSPAPPTLRVAYVHAGGAGGESFALEGLALEGPWPDRLDRATDHDGLGAYRFEVRGAEDGTLLFARGFASVYAEWETTAEAQRLRRGFAESLRFPLPAAPARVSVLRRQPDGAFREVWALAVDPADPTIDRSPLPAAARVLVLQESGPPADKVDLLLIGDGYTAAEAGKWREDARRLMELLFAQSPFRERRASFNVRALEVASQQSGVSRPSDGVYRRSAIGLGYDAFGSERYMLALDERRLRALAAAAPYEFLVLVANDRKYGGGGIFNQYSTVAADNVFTPYLLVHEFAHHFAGLADEYYTSPVAYAARAERPEPWEANVTADPRAAKWAERIEPGTPLPTPWPKAAFEEAQRGFQERRRALRARQAPEAEMEALFTEEQAFATALLAPHAGRAGAFEGAMYAAEGYYRPQADCIMFTRDEVGFCAVCRRALERLIDRYAR